jgi:hypothetical protein
MPEDQIWFKIGAWIIGLLVAALSAQTWWGFRKLTAEGEDIKKSVGSVNARLTSIETWLRGHDKQDDERHVEMKQTIEKLWSKVP